MRVTVSSDTRRARGTVSKPSRRPACRHTRRPGAQKLSALQITASSCRKLIVEERDLQEGRRALREIAGTSQTARLPPTVPWCSATRTETWMEKRRKRRWKDEGKRRGRDESGLG